MEKIILASRSPYRKKLLKQIGIPFKVIPARIEEPEMRQGSYLKSVKSNALKKAQSVAEKNRESLVIGADTIVVCDNEILNKPKNKKDAENMLKKISGRTVKVITAIALVSKKKQMVEAEKTYVKMKKIANKEIKAYIKTGEPLDKSGALAIEGKGAIFVEKINGSFYNVVGLPLAKLYEMLKKRL